MHGQQNIKIWIIPIGILPALSISLFCVLRNLQVVHDPCVVRRDSDRKVE